MKQISVIGKTDSTINLNKIGVPIRGKTRATLTINNAEQEGELMGIVRAGLLEIIQDHSLPSTPSIPLISSIIDISARPKAKQEAIIETVPETVLEKKKGGRPKGAKNKPKEMPKKSQAKDEAKRVAEAEAKTQKMGSKVIVGTLDGPKVGKMTRSAADDITESEQTKASIEAMQKLEKEEDIDLDDTFVDEDSLDASEQMGRKAVVANESGTNQKNMTTSILPESKRTDPFIDRKDKVEIKAIEDNDDLDASFIEI